MKLNDSKGQTFNDGIVEIFAVGNIAAPGDMPKDGLTRKETLRFHRRTIGIVRYYTAMQANQRVDAVLRCPFRAAVSAQDVALFEGQQYKIKLVQRPEDIVPPVMDLTLERLGKAYAIKSG